jgi:hypothetical protein
VSAAADSLRAFFARLNAAAIDNGAQREVLSKSDFLGRIEAVLRERDELELLLRARADDRAVVLLKEWYRLLASGDLTVYAGGIAIAEVKLATQELLAEGVPGARRADRG